MKIQILTPIFTPRVPEGELSGDAVFSGDATFLADTLC